MGQHQFTTYLQSNHVYAEKTRSYMKSLLLLLTLAVIWHFALAGQVYTVLSGYMG